VCTALTAVAGEHFLLPWLGVLPTLLVLRFFQYLVQVRHLDRLEGSWLATMPWLFTLITTPLGGPLSDRLVSRLGYPWGRRLWPVLALALAGLLLGLGTGPAAPSPWTLAPRPGCSPWPGPARPRGVAPGRCGWNRLNLTG
jgi:MFS family permease